MEPNMGMTENEYWSYTLNASSDSKAHSEEASTYMLNRGLSTLLNSRQAKVPPGFSTR